jgi:hypothetical protein
MSYLEGTNYQARKEDEKKPMFSPEPKSHYHKDSELDVVSKWPSRDAFELMDSLKDMWAYGSWHEYNENGPLGYARVFEFATAGWSGNEDLIEALERNTPFWMMFWYQSTRGGGYVFKIRPDQVGYVSALEFAKQKGFTKQHLSRIKDRYDVLKIEGKSEFFRDKK